MGDHKDPVDLGIETSAQPTNQSVDYQPLVNGDPKEPEGSKSGDDPETEMSPEMKEALAHRRRSVTFSDALGVNEVPAEELEGAYANGEVIVQHIHDVVIKWKHFPRYWPLCGEFADNRWIPFTKASDAELWYFLWSAPEQMVELNNQNAGDLRHHRAHYDVTVMRKWEVWKTFYHVESKTSNDLY